MTLRWGRIAPVLLSAWLAGCAQPANRCNDPVQQRWQETGKRFRGELLLVNGGTARGGLDLSGEFDLRDVPTAVPEGTIERACQFTVAIRARRRATASLASPFLSASNHMTSAPNQAFVRGSGMIIDRRGLVLTNEHVIGRARLVEAYISGLGWLPARVVGADPQSDLAVIAVDRFVPAVCQFGDGLDTVMGQPVAAVGSAPPNADDAERAVLIGRLTGRQRRLQGALDPAQGRFYASLVESTIPLPKGYSGGPLIDSDGRVIGINTAAATDPDTGARFGYAIPMSAHIRSIVARLVLGERIEHGFLGLLVRVSRVGSGDTAMAPETGVHVERVLDGSPAARAGIRVGDVITRIDNIPVTGAPQLAERVRSGSPGSPISIQIDRAGQQLTLAATPTARVSHRSNN